MLDHQKIVDDVRASLYTATPEGIDFMRAAAADYMVACDEANERLRHCGNLLKKGLRTEAIQFADIEPVLLDVVATLDFPERPQWSEAIARFGIVAPAPLLVDIAAELNEAYAHEQPLTALLARHRLLALARSPLKLRIGVLRRLAELDASNPLWHDDLLTFERERLKQIQQELADAAQQSDVSSLAVLEEELREPWSELPPPSLISWAAEMRGKVTRHEVRAALEKLVPAWEHAFGTGNVPVGREQRTQWQRLSAIAPPVDGDGLLHRVAPLLAWLDEQDAFVAAEASHHAAEIALDQGLKKGVDSHALEKLHRAVIRGGRGIPERLEKRYQARLVEFERITRGRARARIVAIVIAVCVVGTVIGVSSYMIIQSQHVSATVASLAKLTDGGKFTEAERFVTELERQSAELAANPQVSEEIDRLHGLRNAASERLEAFEAAVRAATAAGLGQPDEVAFRRAEGLANNDAERAKLLDLRGKITAAQAEQRRNRETSLHDAWEKLVARIGELEKSTPMSVAEADQAMAALRAEVKALETSVGTIADPAGNPARSLLAQLDRWQLTFHRRHDRAELDQRIVHEIDQPDKYLHSLQSYAQKFPDDNRTPQLVKAAGEAPLWAQVEAWNSLLNTWEAESAKPIDAVQAKHLADAINKFCADNPQWFYNDTLRQRLAYFTAIVHRNDSEASLQNAMDRLFSDPLVGNLWTVELRDGRKYYCRQPPMPNDNTATLHFKYVTGFDLLEKSRGIKQSEVKYWGTAPQVALAKRATSLLDDLKDETWEGTFQKLVDILLQDGAEALGVDPLLRLTLVQQTVECGSKGSLCLQVAWQTQLQKLKDSKVSAVANWLDPDNAEAATSRRQAEQELNALRAVAHAKDDTGLPKNIVAEQQGLMRSSLGKRAKWIGSLRHGTDGYECKTPADKLPPSAGRLCVVMAKGDVVTLQKIGEATAQGLKIDNTGKDAKAALLDGRPVYVIGN